jgi:hypothetical protein
VMSKKDTEKLCDHGGEVHSHKALWIEG